MRRSSCATRPASRSPGTVCWWRSQASRKWPTRLLERRRGFLEDPGGLAEGAARTCKRLRPHVRCAAMGFLWIVILLGIVEGVTEFIPVSSTGHLIVAGRLLGFAGEKSASFEIFIQLGAILAVFVLERRRFIALARPGAAKGFSGARGCGLLAITTLPALLMGYLLRDVIRGSLFNPASVALALGAGGLAILLAERLRPAP